MSVGFNYTKSTGIRTGSVNISSQYQAEQLKATLDISAYETSSPDTETSARENLTSTVQFQRERPSFLMLLNSLERNDELGIDARLTTGGGLARYFGQDQDSEIMLLAGARRQPGMDQRRGRKPGCRRQPAKSRRRARRELAHLSFQRSGNQPGLDGLSLSEPHGVGPTPRHLDISLRREIISDLFFDISFYESYDSDPPSAGETTDYGIVTSLGYKF